jgi:hypothetical protein
MIARVRRQLEDVVGPTSRTVWSDEGRPDAMCDSTPGIEGVNVG